MYAVPSIEVDSVSTVSTPSVVVSQSTSTSFTSPTPQTTLSSRRNVRRKIGLVWWNLVPDHANVHRNSNVSRIWEYGAEYMRPDRLDRPHRWICDYCDGSVALQTSQQTSNACRHLKDKHRITIKRGRSVDLDVEYDERTHWRRTVDGTETPIESPPQAHFVSLTTSINVDRFRQLLIQWVVQSRIPFRAVEDTRFRDLLLYLAPSLQRYLIRNHTTLSNWVQDDYGLARQQLRDRLANSHSRVHFSFDPWTSPASAPILGVCAHFLGPNLTLESPLVGLKEIDGAHTGENLGEIIASLIRELGIPEKNKIGVYVCDNASNMTSTVRTLVKIFHPEESRSERDEPPRRARCLGHIINLAAQSFLLGKNVRAFENEILVAEQATVRDLSNLAVEQAKWRTKGPVGKFHNVVKWIRASPQRRQQFKLSIDTIITEMKNANEPVDFDDDLMVVLDNSTRWNSSYYSIQRGLRLRHAIDLFLLRFGDEVKDDNLTVDDWEQLVAVEEALRPFKEMTLRLEGHAKQGSHGVIWEALPSLDLLLSTLEEKRVALSAIDAINARGGRRHNRPVNPLLVCYQNAWQVLKEYNDLTDKNHEIYAAATLLNPCLRKAYFERQWTGDEEPLIAQIIAKNRSLWEDRYMRELPIEAATEFDSPFDTFLSGIQVSAGRQTDDFDAYINGTPLRYRTWFNESIFRWWMDSPYIGLRQWAFDLLSVPAMSAEMERMFSQASRFITVDRNRLTVAVLEQLLCLKNWLDNKYLPEKLSGTPAPS